ncbi:MerR family transcriptional regulator [Streptomyces anulatus]|uniref:MerR family transcriptional regulator n=1 Tax=Streptomyces anulatus TaxID=1892 RepID=UPI003F4D62EE
MTPLPSAPGARERRLSGMRIGELSKRTGVSSHSLSLRHYEDQGLLTSSRSDTGQRHNSAASVQRVSLIRQLLDAGIVPRSWSTRSGAGPASPPPGWPSDANCG